VKKTRQIKEQSLRSDSIGTEEAPKRQSGADPVFRPPGTLTTPENTYPGAII
jgi:hypothetical protein